MMKIGPVVKREDVKDLLVPHLQPQEANNIKPINTELYFVHIKHKFGQGAAADEVRIRTMKGKIHTYAVFDGQDEYGNTVLLEGGRSSNIIVFYRANTNSSQGVYFTPTAQDDIFERTKFHVLSISPAFDSWIPTETLVLGIDKWGSSVKYEEIEKYLKAKRKYKTYFENEISFEKYIDYQYDNSLRAAHRIVKEIEEIIGKEILVM